jgi:hypothetical protein
MQPSSDEAVCSWIGKAGRFNPTQAWRDDMTRLNLAAATAASLLLAISGTALAQGVGGTAPEAAPGGTSTAPKSDSGGAPTGLPAQGDEGMSPRSGAGSASGPSAIVLPNVDKMTPAQIEARLQSNGFDNVRNLKRQGDAYNATATKDGQPVKLQIDASSGRVTTTNN